MRTRTLTIAALMLTYTYIGQAADAGKMPPPSNKKGVTFAADIKPIVEKSCVKCHSGEKPKAKLRLDSLENVLKGAGGEKPEKVLEPGKSADSKIVKATSHIGDEDGWMPPPNNRANIGPLTPAQIGLIRAWIDQGAK